MLSGSRRDFGLDMQLSLYKRENERNSIIWIFTHKYSIAIPALLSIFQKLDVSILRDIPLIGFNVNFDSGLNYDCRQDIAKIKMVNDSYTRQQL